nr:winged helix-turn-helix domain-containing protein [Microbispora sp. H13382]
MTRICAAPGARSYSPPATRSGTASRGWTRAPTTTWSSRSTSPSWWPGCGRWAGAETSTARCCGVGDLELDPVTHRAWRAGAELELTSREFALLRYFMHHPGRVPSAEDLLEHVWDANANPFTTSVRVILSRLRRKLGDPPVITTVTAAGYRLEGPRRARYRPRPAHRPADRPGPRRRPHRHVRDFRRPGLRLPSHPAPPARAGRRAHGRGRKASRASVRASGASSIM